LKPQSADRRVEKLRRDHAVDDFDCGREELNRFLRQFAWPSQQANASNTYVGLVGETVVGYHSLAFGHVRHEDAPERVTKGMAKHPIPIMLLARLAVDRRWQRQGIGSGLLKDAMQRTLQAADMAGVRALAVHAKDKEARGFYEHFDFVPSPTDPLHLFILLKDMRRLLGSP
jgi:GNAT superfamily N-acetyltransferase